MCGRRLAVLEDAADPLVDMALLDGPQIGGLVLLHEPQPELTDGAATGRDGVGVDIVGPQTSKERSWLVAAVALVLAAGPVAAKKPAPPPPEPVAITVAMPPFSVCALLYVAADHGLFAANGVAVTIRDDYAAGVFALQDLIRGSADMAVIADFVLARGFDPQAADVVLSAGEAVHVHYA